MSVCTKEVALRYNRQIRCTSLFLAKSQLTGRLGEHQKVYIAVVCCFAPHDREMVVANKMADKMKKERLISAQELHDLFMDDASGRSATSFCFNRLHRAMSGRELRSILGEALGWKQENGNSVEEKIRRPSEFGENQTFSEKEVLKILEERSRLERSERYESFVGMLTLHGYPQFDASSGIRKCLWGIVLLIMTSLVVRLALLSYSRENILKQIIELETEKAGSLDFPTVTICAYSPQYIPSMLKQFPLNITEEEYRKFYFQLLSNRREEVTGIDKPFVQKMLRDLKAKGYTSYREVLSLFEKNREEDINSIAIKKIMKHTRCLYENKPCDFKKDFKIVYRHNSQSLCLQFNSYGINKAPRVTTGNDLENGFFMFWDISGEHYFYDFGLHGLLMEIHPYGTPHNLIDHRNTIYLEPGSMANIDVEEVETHRLAPPFKPACGEVKPEVLRGFPYSEAVCETDCYLEMALQKCGCVPDQFEEFANHHPICEAADMPCVFNATMEVHCHGCPVRCHDVHYHFSQTLLSIGNNALAISLKHDPDFVNKTKQEIVAYTKQYIVGFRIGFKSLERTLRNYVEAMAWFDRFSLLGGTVGLLMGLSVTTCFEFFFFVIDYIIIYAKYRLFQKYIDYLMKKRR